MKKDKAFNCYGFMQIMTVIGYNEVQGPERVHLFPIRGVECLSKTFSDFHLLMSVTGHEHVDYLTKIWEEPAGDLGPLTIDRFNPRNN